MKKTLLSLAFLSLSSIAFAQKGGVEFEKSSNLSQIKAKAKEEHKYIFMDLFATWCGPCKQMDSEVYPIPEVGSFMNKKFIAVKVQMDKTSEDAPEVKSWYKDADSIKNAYGISSFPSFLFFSPEGILVHRAEGFMNAQELIKLASESLNHSREYDTQLARFKAGELNNNALKKLALNLKDAGDGLMAQTVADAYMNNYLFKLSDGDLFSHEHLSFIGTFIGSAESKAFNLFKEHSARINTVLGDYQAEYKLMDFIDRRYLPQRSSLKMTVPDWDAIQKKVTKKFGTLGEEIALGKRMIYYWGTARMDNRWEEFGKYYVRYFKKALKHPIFHVNNMSWSVFEHVHDPEVLNFAVEVIKYSLENGDQNNVAAYDTFANLLYKTGKIKEAIVWEEKAVKLKSGAPDEQLYIQALDKMKKRLPTWKTLNK